MCKLVRAASVFAVTIPTPLSVIVASLISFLPIRRVRGLRPFFCRAHHTRVWRQVHRGADSGWI